MTTPLIAKQRLATLGLEFQRYDFIRPEWCLPAIPDDFTKRYPYYPLVPKEFYANLEFRRQMIELGMESEDNAHELWIMCARDILFWANTFVWILEPRDPNGEVVKPFISYPFQDALFCELDEIWGREDFNVEKSRAMGISWCLMIREKHGFQFDQFHSVGVASAVADSVDSLDDPDSLFMKARFLLENQPAWLKPRWRSKVLNFTAPERNNFTEGSPTKADMFRGGRRRVVVVDESASVPNSHEVDAALTSVTNCRIDNSTPKGATGSFYERTRMGSNQRKLTIHWTLPHTLAIS